MKNEKFCFDKKMGIISLVGIVFVFMVLASQTLTSTQTSTNSRASEPKSNLAVKKPYPSCAASSQYWYGSYIDCATPPDKNEQNKEKTCAESGYVADNTFSEKRCLDEYTNSLQGGYYTRFYQYFEKTKLEVRSSDEIKRGDKPCAMNNSDRYDLVRCFLNDELKITLSGWEPKDPNYKNYIQDRGKDGATIGCPVLVKRTGSAKTAEPKTVELGTCYVRNPLL